jgi:hypothetical protein
MPETPSGKADSPSKPTTAIGIVGAGAADDLDGELGARRERQGERGDEEQAAKRCSHGGRGRYSPRQPRPPHATPERRL